MNKTANLDKIKGCLLGLACGDYLGMPVEFFNRDQVIEFFGGFKLKPMKCTHRSVQVLPEGYYTDDTAMTICLTESLIENGFDIKDQFRRYKKWLMEGYATPFNDKAFGIGRTTLRSLFTWEEKTLPTELTHNERQGGNGALMRCSPIGLAYYNNESDLVTNTIKSTVITHNNLIAVWSCIIQNMFIRYALLNYQKSSFIDRFLFSYSDKCPQLLIDVLKTDFTSVDEAKIDKKGYSLSTLLIALYSFFTTDNYENCITKAVFIGGDTDTQASVAGALAGAYYGYESIPKLWSQTLIKKEYIADLAEQLYQKQK